MRAVASGWFRLLAIGASLAVPAPTMAYGLPDQAVHDPRTAAGESPEPGLLCFRNDSIMASLLSEADLRVERVPDRRRRSGFWNGSSPVDAGKETSCFTSGTNRGGFFSG